MHNWIGKLTWSNHCSWPDSCRNHSWSNYHVRRCCCHYWYLLRMPCTGNRMIGMHFWLDMLWDSLERDCWKSGCRLTGAGWYRNKTIGLHAHTFSFSPFCPSILEPHLANKLSVSHIKEMGPINTVSTDSWVAYQSCLTFISEK